jgi:diguanylate cyclase (GGDEF)-like protein/PAS domain S-box-containing protein
MTSEVVCCLGADGRLTDVSAAVEFVLGHRRADLLGAPASALCHPEDVLAWPESHPADGRVLSGRIRVRHADRTWRWMETRSRCLRGGPEGQRELLIIARDITEQVELETTLRRSEAGYRQLVETASEGIARLDVAGVFEYINERHAAFLGREPDDILGRHVSEFVDPTAQEVLSHRRVGRREGVSERFEVPFIRPDGEQVWALVSSSPLQDETGHVHGAMSLVTDITELKAAERRLAQLALHDSVTGLPNRRQCELRLREALENAAGDGTVAVAVCDVDQFKAINDVYGHAVGDHVLRVVGERLRQTVRAEDTVGRLGGDEYLVIAEGLHGQQAFHEFLRRLERRLAEPIRLEDHELAVTISVGLSGWGAGDDRSAQTLLHEADEAMYAAKRQGRGNTLLFAGDVRKRVMRRLAIRAELHRASNERQFVLHYQPVVDIDTGRPRGVEALLRWDHDVLGSVSPNEFVPIAEESGLITGIGSWVLREACRQAAIWQRAGDLGDMHVAVNVSAKQLSAGDQLVRTVRSALADSGLEPHQLMLELTETALMAAPALVIRTLGQLKEIGVGLAIDDFGTGYSSLLYLKQFPVDVLKVDRSFVSGLPEESDDLAIVAAVTGLAKAVSVRTVAEGVETESQLAMLGDLGCTYGQGYLWSRPLPAAQVPVRLRELRRSRVPATSPSS